MIVGLTACSDGQLKEWKQQNNELCRIMEGMGIETVMAEHIYAKQDAFSGTDAERAEDLMRFYRDDSVDAIYDISGGDLANGVLKYLDWDIIAKSNKTYWGYSDLTTILNAIYAKTGRESVLYQVKNMVYAKGELQQKRFADYLSGKSNDLFDLNYEFLQGTYLEGIVVGGNIRCLLKLAGTEFWPDMTGKILLLESYGGETGGIATAMNQLDLMGVFDQVAGVLLGTFSKYEEAALSLGVFDLLKMHISDTLPVVKTTEIGHSPDSKAIVIGRNMKLKKGNLWQIH
ncbi:MAG: LD-carboxypeptidase [Lachnospiraceae bacterium]|nr:LD-carboxypeptidase [Lachnospiraceae bacterium]MBR0430536.1 LD-carboxypeptidase [Lachnospiraceae bacterium]